MTESSSFLDVISVLHEQPVLALFLIIGIGYLIGAIRIGTFSLGPVAGVLFAGIFLGNFDFKMDPGAQSVGFALFIFSVGYQAGPRFFDVLRTDGLRYFLLALVVASTGFGVAVALTKVMDFAPGTSAGLLAGGLTSSPTLAAAQEALRSGQVAAPDGISTDAMMDNVATGYAITYIFGLAGLIAIIKLLPNILGIDLKAEAKKLESADASSNSSQMGTVSSRVYRLTNEALTQLSIKELKEKYWDKTSVVRVRRDGNILPIDADDDGDIDIASGKLKLNDELLVLAPIEYYTHALADVGEEIDPKQDFDQFNTGSAKVVVTKKMAIGKTLAELDLPQYYGVLLMGITRMGTVVPCNQDTVVNRGDVLTVMGGQDYVNVLGVDVGHVERDIAETDMVTFAFGIAFGVMIGMLGITVGQLSIGLGSAGACWLLG
ncbi:TrkA C-terminal domain-containing protein [Oceanicoccus sagamiensis]|uniref:RCK C-terminal domain-containing protein n=1 Tax=Oceanicoccus sagamiensis TaxID=716816 RepID=A0A1X9NF91_9GAMM|nr:TrkA C-terminal domain-containing protein [Oceanicoccus sagamiensis]ARN72693.1 hypothetical protein BST96_00325 [Oceanicoccus sagamiensis]